MRSPAAPFLLALLVTAIVLTAVSMTPYFAGDVTVARALQSLSPDTAWAAVVTRTALAPGKYVLMAMTVALSYALAGWKGAAIALAAIAIEQTGGEASKMIAQRPRPLPDLVKVVGNPSGYSFPSTFTTFYAATFGTVWLLAGRARPSAVRTVVLILAPLAIALGWTARVVLGAHWPSDVVLSTVVFLTWVWAAIRVVLPR